MRRDDRVFLLGEDIGVTAARSRSPRLPGGVRRRARHRHADAESGFVGAGMRRGDQGLRPVVEMQFADFIACAFDQIVNYRGQGALPHGHARPDRRARPVGRRLLAAARSTRRTPKRRSRTCPASRSSARRRPHDAKGLLNQSIRDNEPGALLRAQAPLSPHPGRGARGRLHRAVRRRRIERAGRRPDARHLGRDGAHAPGGGRAGRGRARHLGRGHRPAHDRARGTARRFCNRSRAPARRSCCTRTRAPPVSAPRSRPPSARRSSRSSTPPSCALTAPDTPVPFSPPLEQRFIPQVDDVAGRRPQALRLLIAGRNP